MQAFEFSFRIGDKALCACGELIKWSFKMIFKMMYSILKFVFGFLYRKSNLYKLYDRVSTPFLTVNRTAISYAPNSKLVRSVNREPVVIEHPQQKN